MMGKMNILRRKLRRKFYEVGVLGAFILGVRRLFKGPSKNESKKKGLDYFDAKYGTDTGGAIKPEEQDISDEKVLHSTGYRTAITEVFLELLKSLQIPHQDFFFVDIGAGKGRAMLLASLLPFKRIIGVEFSESLHKIASANIRVFRDENQKCHDIRSIYQDATEFDIPEEKIVFYMFNPFDAHIMRKLVDNINQSLRKYPREIWILYIKSVWRDVITSSPYFHVVRETENYIVFNNTHSLNDKLGPLISAR